MDFPLIRFARRTTYALRVINLPSVLDEGWKALRTEVTFIVVDASYSYNTILVRTTLNPNKIVASTCQRNIKFLTPHGIGEIKEMNLLRGDAMSMSSSVATRRKPCPLKELRM